MTATVTAPPEIGVLCFNLKRPHPQAICTWGRGAHTTSNSFSLYKALPIEIYVCEIPEPRNQTYSSPCKCEQVYRVTSDSIAWLRRRALLKRGLSEERAPVVCACMGEVLTA